MTVISSIFVRVKSSDSQMDQNRQKAPATLHGVTDALQSWWHRQTLNDWRTLRSCWMLLVWLLEHSRTCWNYLELKICMLAHDCKPSRRIFWYFLYIYFFVHMFCALNLANQVLIQKNLTECGAADYKNWLLERCKSFLSFLDRCSTWFSMWR